MKQTLPSFRVDWFYLAHIDGSCVGNTGLGSEYWTSPRDGKVQGDQLNMAVFIWFVVKSDCPVYACTVAYTEQVSFYKVPDKHGHVYLAGLYVCMLEQLIIF